MTAANLVCVETWTEHTVTIAHDGQLHGADCDRTECIPGNIFWVLTANQCTLVTSGGGTTTSDTNNSNIDFNNPYGNGSTGGSTSSTPATLSTGALLVFELSNALNLTPEIGNWLEIKQNWGKGQMIRNFLAAQKGFFLLDMQGNTSSPDC